MVVMAEVIGGTAILLCILLVIYAISRYFGIHLIENMSLAGRRKYQTPQYSANAVKNPFSLQVDADSCSSSGVCQDLSQGGWCQLFYLFLCTEWHRLFQTSC